MAFSYIPSPFVVFIAGCDLDFSFLDCILNENVSLRKTDNNGFTNEYSFWCIVGTNGVCVECMNGNEC